MVGFQGTGWKVSWDIGLLDDSAQLSPLLLRVSLPPHLQHPPLLQPQLPLKPPQQPVGSGCQAEEAVEAVGAEGPRAPPLGPAVLPAASAGPPLQLPGAVPLLGGLLVPGGALRKGPSVGEGIMGAGPCCTHTLQHKGRCSWAYMLRDVHGVIREELIDQENRGRGIEGAKETETIYIGSQKWPGTEDRERPSKLERVTETKEEWCRRM